METKAKIEIVKTIEADGDWYKVEVDGFTKACIRITGRTPEEALEKATTIYDFYILTNGIGKQIIRSNQ